MNKVNVKNINKHSPVLPIILSVACAFVLWMYVMSVESPSYTQTFNNVEVILRNDSVISKNGLSVLSGMGRTVDVTVVGRKSVINRMSADDIVAYVDLSGINSAGTYQPEIKTDLETGLSLDGLSEKTITVYIDMTTSKTVPIDSDIEYNGGVTKGNEYSMGHPYILSTADMQDSTSVVVNGPVTILNTISYAKVRTVEIGPITSSVKINSPLVLYDEDGAEVKNQYVSMVTPQVSVYFPVVTEKNVSVLPNFTGTFDTSKYSYTVSPSTVRVRAEESVLDSISSVTFDVSKSDSALLGVTKYALTADGMEIADGTTEVSLTVRQKPDNNSK